MNIDLIYSTALGIEIDEDFWTLAYLGRTFTTITLHRHAVIPSKKIPFADKEEEKEFLSKVERFLLEAGANTDNVVAGLPSSKVIYKTLNIPSVKKKDIQSIMSFEIEKHMPFPVEEAYYDYQILKQENGRFEVMIAITRKDVVDSLLELLEKIDIKPSILHANTFGLLNAFTQGGKLQKNKNTALIHISHNNMDVHTVTGNIPITTRILPIDKQSAWLKQLENIIRLIPAGIPMLEKKLDNIFIISSAFDKETPEKIKTALNTNADIENPLKDAVKGSIDTETLSSITTAAGLAIKGLGRGRIKLNLLPPHYRKPENRGGIITAYILVGLIIIIGIGDIASRVIKERLMLKGIDRKLAVIKPDTDEVNALRKKVLDIETRLNIIYAIRRKDISKLDIMSELANILPSDTWVTNMEYTKGELHISGLSSSASNLLSILEGSNLFENAEFVGAITSVIEGKERFRIRMRIAGVKIDASR